MGEGALKPWEMFSQSAEPEEPVAPAAPPAAATAEPAAAKPDMMDTIEDVGQTVPAGLARGVASGVGAGGDLRDLVMMGAEKAGVVSPETVEKAFKYLSYVFPQASAVTKAAPTSSEVKQAIEKNVTGELYEPKTPTGKLVGSAAEFAGNPLSYVGPGGMGMKLLQALSGGVGSEALGQALEGKDGEGVARIIGALIGGYAPRGVAHVVTPSPIDASRQAALNTIRQEGIQPTAGQATGNKALQYAESYLGDAPFAGGKATEAAQTAGQQFAGAALRRAGENELRATPDVLDSAFNRIGRQMDDLAANNVLQFDVPFLNRVNRATRRYHDLFLDPLTRPQVEHVQQMAMNQITTSLQGGVGSLPGQAYQASRETLEALSKSQNTRLKLFANEVRQAYDQVMERSIRRNNPADAGAWREAQRQYRNLIPISRAASVDTEGTLTPQKMRQALQAQNRRAYERGRGDLNRLTRAGNTILQQLPNSGTAQRLGIITGVGGVGGALTGDTMEDKIKRGLMGAAAPALAGRFLMSRPTQAYLANQRATDILRRMPPSRYRTGLVGATQALPDDEEE